LPAVRNGIFPLQSKAASPGEEPAAFVRVSTTRRRADPHPLTPGVAAQARRLSFNPGREAH